MEWHEIFSDAQRNEFDIHITRSRLTRLEEHHNALIARIEDIEENCKRLFEVANQNFITLNNEIKALGGFSSDE